MVACKIRKLQFSWLDNDWLGHPGVDLHTPPAIHRSALYSRGEGSVIFPPGGLCLFDMIQCKQQDEIFISVCSLKLKEIVLDKEAWKDSHFLTYYSSKISTMVEQIIATAESFPKGARM